MNVVPMFDLNRATVQRRIDLLPLPLARTRCTPGGVCFTRSPLGLGITYIWGGGAYRSTVRIMPYGGRYAIFRCAKFDRMVTGRQLLAALAEYRRSAAIARMDRTEAQA